MSNCSICCDKFTKLNKDTKCQFCDFSACGRCHKTYVFGTTNEFHCMSCKKQWSDEYIASQFTKKMYNTELRKHRENIIVEKEKPCLPAAQECLNRYKKYKNYIKHIEDCKHERKSILRQLEAGAKVDWYRYNCLSRSIEISDEKIETLKRWVVGEKTDAKKVEWVWKCPDGNCRGFMDNQHCCGVCNKHWCPQCHDELEEGHTCDEDKKKSIQMICKDSKPCPKCSTVIYKIDGCDQMWCPDCKTAFSWEWGTIETKIHNPHYYEYLRNTKGHVPREEGDGCGFPLRPYLINECKDQWSMDVYLALFRTFMHSMNHTKNQWIVNQQDEETELKLLRVQYLSKDLSYDKWKWNLQKRDKHVRKCKEICQVFDTLTNAGGDIFSNTNQEVDDIIEQAGNLLEFVNEAFVKISKRFKCVVPQFRNVKSAFVDCVVATCP